MKHLYKSRVGEVWCLRGGSTPQYRDGFSYIGVVVKDDPIAKRHMLFALDDPDVKDRDGRVTEWRDAWDDTWPGWRRIA